MNDDQCQNGAFKILNLVADKFPSEAQLDFYELAELPNPHFPQNLPDQVRWYFDLTRFLVEEGYLRAGRLREDYGLGSVRITSRGLALLGRRLFDEPGL